MLVPIALGTPRQLENIVVVSGVAAVVSNSASLAFASVYPALGSATRATVSIRASAAVLVGISGIVSLVGVVASALGSSFGELFVWFGIMSLCQGTYVMVNGVLVREANWAVYARARLWYGISNLVLTFAATVFFNWQFSLVAVASMVFIVGATFGIVGLRGSLRRIFCYSANVLSRRQRYSTYLRSALPATLSNLLQLGAFSLSAVVVPFMGEAAHFWSIVVRIGGGFGTVLMQVVAPAYEMKLAAALRESSRRDVRAVNRRGTAVGVLAAVMVAPVAVFISLRWSSSPVDFPSIASGAVFVASIIGGAVVYKNLVLCGRARKVMVAMLVKMAVVLPLLLMLPGQRWPAALAAGELAFIVLYVWFLLSYRNAGRHVMWQGKAIAEESAR